MVRAALHLQKVWMAPAVDSAVSLNSDSRLQQWVPSTLLSGAASRRSRGPGVLVSWCPGVLVSWRATWNARSQG
jgi:hypothetical protein